MSVLTKRQRYSPSNDSESIQSSESSIRSNTSCENPVRHLFLIRHGQYERERTQNDGHLTTSGEKQAWYAADFLLSQLPENVLFDSLTHSDSKRNLLIVNEFCLCFKVIRTRETARIIYKHLQSMKKINIEYYSIDTDFREHNLLIQFLFEGNWRALKRDYFRLKKSFLRNDQTTFEIIITHRNIIGHCIELLTMIQPDKSIAFNASVTVCLETMVFLLERFLSFFSMSLSIERMW